MINGLKLFLHGYLAVFIVIGSGIALTALGFQLMQSWEHQKAESNFERMASDQVGALRNELLSDFDVIRSVGAFYAASSFVDRQEFQLYASSVMKSHPGVQALEWIPRITPTNRGSHEILAIEDQLTDFQIWNHSGDGSRSLSLGREEYFPVYYVEPMAGNEADLGFDLASNGTRKDAMNLARDSGQLAASGRITLVQETEEEFGFLAFFPIYHNNSATETINDRREHLAGFVLGVFRVEEIVGASFLDTTTTDQDLGWRTIIYDRSARPGEELLFTNNVIGDSNEETSHQFQHADNLVVGRRTWEVSVAANRPGHSFVPWATVVMGTLFTGLVTAYILAAAQRTSTIKKLVGLRTGELLQANDLLEIEAAERRSAEEEIRNSEHRLRSVLDNLLDGIIVIDEAKLITSFNPAAERIFGFAAAEVLGQNVKMLMPEPYHAEHDQYVQNYINTGERKIIGIGREVEGRRQDGSTFPMELAVSEFTVSGTRMYTGIIRDVTEKKAMERMKDEFVSVVSHELRTPLTSIRGSLGLLAGGALGELSGQAQKMAQIAARNTDRLVKLINDILDIERLESGKIQLDQKGCDVGAIMTQSVEAVQGMADEAGVVLRVEAAPENAVCDPDRIAQVCTNLLGNAIKFSPPAGIVSLGMEVQEDSLVVYVRDQGRGIPEDKLDTIFERFQQVDASDSREKGGTGLGLAICQTIVQQHGGKIWVDSVIGEGSTFSFTLARSDQPVHNSEPSVIPDAHREDSTREELPRVILAMDTVSLRGTMTDLLIEYGYDVISAGSIEETLVKASEFKPDAILLDLKLPDIGGNLILRLNQDPSLQGVPIIVLSGMMPQEISAANQGVFGWIENPLDQSTLLSTLNQAMEGRPNKPRVLLVEDDNDLAEVLTAMFTRNGISVSHAETSDGAIKMCQKDTPNLLVLDLALARGTGYEVVDWLKRHEVFRHAPLVVYSASELDPSDRDRLQLGNTSFVTKGRVPPEELQRQVINLLGRIVSPGEKNGNHRSQTGTFSR